MIIYRHIFLYLNIFLYKCRVLRCSPRPSMSWVGPHSSPGKDHPWQQRFGHDPPTHCDTSHGHLLQGHCHNNHPSHSQRYLHTVTESVTTGAGEDIGNQEGRSKPQKTRRGKVETQGSDEETGSSCARARARDRRTRRTGHLMGAMEGQHTTHEGMKRYACVARHLSMGTTRG